MIVFGSQKGGTGKSTACTNLAVALARTGKDVLVLDTDPQRTASNWAARRDEQADLPGVHCIQKVGAGSLIPTLGDLRGRYEVILIDTSGHDSPEFRSALMLADRVVVACRPSQADIETLIHVDEVVQSARAMRLDGGPASGVLMTMVPTHRAGREFAEACEFVTQGTSLGQMQAFLRDRKAYRDALLRGLGVIEGLSDLAAEEIQTLFREVTP